MKKLIVALVLLCSVSASAQFPTTDSLRKYINRWIRNSAVDAFTNLRLNTALLGMTRFADSTYGGQVQNFVQSTPGILTLTLLNGDVFTVDISTSTGTLTSVGSGATLVKSSTEIKSVVGSSPIIVESNLNTITIRGDTSILATRSWVGTQIPDSSVYATVYRVDTAKSNIRTQIEARQPAGNYISQLNGDVIANGPGNANAVLANTTVIPGTYTNTTVTVDAKGRITFIDNGVGGGGGSTDNILLGTGYRILVPASQGIKTLFGGYGVNWDSTSYTQGLTVSIDSTKWITTTNFANKISYGDTSALFLAYRNAINQRLMYGDTTTMLSNYLTAINSRLRISDTAAMLLAYRNALNTKQGLLTLTTTGTSGAATLVGNTLNIPQYSPGTYTAGVRLTLTGNQFNVDTLSLLAPYQTALNARVRYADTSSILTAYRNALNTKLQNVTGYITAGSNVTVTGAGTLANPYVIASSGGSGGSSYIFTPADFNEAGSTISIDYTNGQAASGSTKGFLNAADWTTFNNKQNAITTGTTAQYLRGDLSLATFPTAVSAFTNDAGYLTNITGKVTAGTNVSITGSGTTASPYVVSSTATGLTNGDKGDITVVDATNWNIDALAVGNAEINDVAWTKITGIPSDIVYTGATQTLTNKTLTSPVINVGTDATGDVYYRSAGGLFTRLPIGSTGQVLKVVGGVPAWAVDATSGGGGATLADGDYGSVTVSGTGTAITIDPQAVSNSMLANVPTNTIRGRITSGTGSVEDLTVTQATSMLNTFTTSLKGLAPASGGGTTNFLRADGTWAAPASGYSFEPNDFNGTTNISIDYANGQKATSSVPGFLTAADWATFNAKQAAITTGTTAQYFRGDLSLATFPTAVSAFTNDAGYLTNITGKITAGTNVSITGSGTTASPYVINSTAGGTGTVTSFAFTNGNGFTGSVSNSTTTPTLSLTLQDADAGGVTKGQAGFTAADFNASSGIISIDYANGQAASSSAKGFLTAADWIAFNVKQGALTLTTTGTSGPATLIGNTLNIPQYSGGGGTTYTGTADRITVSGSVIDIASTYVGQTSITTLGTIATGVWNGTAISNAKGGMPTGGTAGQMLYKSSSTDYAATWGPAPTINIDNGYGISIDGENNISIDTASISAKYLLRGAITAGTNVTITGAGTGASPYVVSATGGSGVTDGDKTDITISSLGSVYAIDAGVVTNTKLANMAGNTFKGRQSTTGAPEDLTGTQATAMLDNFTSSTKGLAPASGGGTTNFLRADGTWVLPPSADTVSLSNRIDYKENVYNVKAYGAKGDLIQRTDGAASGSSFTSASGNFTSADIGKRIVINGAGSGGADYYGTISAVGSSTSVTVSPSVGTSVSGKQYYYATNDNPAFQAAVNAAAASGGKVYVPDGAYGIGGALQSPSNSQIQIPAVVPTGTEAAWAARTHITIEGETPPNFTPAALFIDWMPSLKGTVLVSMIAGSGTNPSVIGTRASGENLTYHYLSVKNLTILTPRNNGTSGPTIGGINYLKGASLYTDQVLVCLFGSMFTSAQPTNEVSGIQTPEVGSETMTSLKNTMVIGYKYGIVTGEHTVLDQVQVFGSDKAFVFARNAQALIALRISATWCKTAIYIPPAAILDQQYTNSFVSFKVLQLMQEWRTGTPTWFNTNYTIEDAGNAGQGELHYQITQEGTGINSSLFTKLGASGTQHHAIDQDFLKPYNMVASMGGKKYVLGGQAAPSSSTGFGATTAMLELGTGVVTSTDEYFGDMSFTTSQTNANGTIGRIMFNNPSSPDTDKRLFQIAAATINATDRGILNMAANNGTAVELISQFSTNGFAFYKPLVIMDGTQGAGKVLVSDADGLATWTDPGSIGGGGGGSNWTVSGANIYNSNSGNVGIGTSSPATLLNIRKDQNTGTRSLIENYSTGTAAFSAFSAVNNASSVFQAGIIGTNNPGFLTVLPGAAFIYSDASNGLGIVSENGPITFGAGSGGITIAQSGPVTIENLDDATAVAKMVVSTNGVLSLQAIPGGGGGSQWNDNIYGIDNPGNVGIGINLPLHPLHVYSDINGGRRIYLDNPNAGSSAFSAIVSHSNAGLIQMGILSSANPGFLAVPAGGAFVYTDAAAGMTFVAENGPFIMSAGVSTITMAQAGGVTMSDLAGSGTRMVVASSTGLLSTQAIPSGGGFTSPLTTTGDLLSYSGGTHVRVAAGTSGYYLGANGAGALPSWKPMPNNGNEDATYTVLSGATFGATGASLGGVVTVNNGESGWFEITVYAINSTSNSSYGHVVKIPYLSTSSSTITFGTEINITAPDVIGSALSAWDGVDIWDYAVDVNGDMYINVAGMSGQNIQWKVEVKKHTVGWSS